MRMLPDVLYNRRRELNLTLRDIAQCLNITESTVQRWESGYVRNIKYDYIVKLAELLQVSPVDLLTDTKDETSTPTEKVDVDDPLTTAIMTELRQIPKNEKELILSVIRSIADKYSSDSG